MSAPALVLPATATLGLAGRYRATAEDFVVDEVPGWVADGAGEHLLVHVEKRGANTDWVVRRLAERLGVEAGEIGFCGAKDRHAVTRQWFSVRDPDGDAALAPGAGEADWTVLATARHGRKLRRGDHAGNRFRLRLLLDGGAADAGLREAVATTLAAGVANAFGPQRFGRDGANLAAAAEWVGGRRLPRRGPVRGRILSAARSHLFNRVLVHRLAADCAATVVDGEVLAEDGGPTGPLWGRGRPPATGTAARLEAEALEGYGEWTAALEHAGLAQERRPLVLRPEAVAVTADPAGLVLAFELPPGAFATAVLAGLGDFVDAAGADGAPADGDEA
jgi:tRNA pseudouridine13 synthase